MPKQRKDIQIFSLYFLDGMCCAFGAVIMLLLITKQSEPHIIEQSRVHQSGLIAALQKELFELRGETDVLNREMNSLEVDVSASRGLLASLQGDLTKIRGKFAASKEDAKESDVQGQLLAARQQLTEEMRRLLANYKPPENDTTIGGIPVDSEYIIFVIDNSGSMYQGPWRLVMRKITETLNVYPRVKGIQVMNNDGRYLMTSYAGKWIPDSQAIRGRIISALANFTAFSDSNPTEGIVTAVNTFYEPGKKISIYYMGDDFPEGQVEAVARYVEKINKSDEFGNRLVRIHAIGFPTQIAGGQMVNAARFSNLMRTLCERNGGSFIALSTLD
jgi:hypothetical protein